MLYWLLCAIAESGVIPDWLTRWGARKLLNALSRKMRTAAAAAGPAALNDAFVADVLTKPITFRTEAEAANAQHYEVPAAFFNLVLGPRKKYSLCEWDDGCTTLAEAETTTLRRFAEFAGLAPGMRVLDLGCGWGSLCLFLVEAFPDIAVCALSNSHSQRDSIMRTYGELAAAAAARGGRVAPLEVVTGDVGLVEQPTWASTFDAIMSVEMFEHMQNYRALFTKLRGWLRPGGSLSVHVFDNAYAPERFEDDSWIGRHFFTGGTMPSRDLLVHPSLIGGLFTVAQRRTVDGDNYRKTANAWLSLLDGNKAAVRTVLRSRRALHRWRIFFIVTAETWGHSSKDWEVSWYRFVAA